MGMVGLGGLEPPASPLSGVRSNQLSYRPGEPPSAVRASLLRKLGEIPDFTKCELGERPRPGTVPGAQRSKRERQTIRVSARPGHSGWIGSSGTLLVRSRLAARSVAPRGAKVTAGADLQG